MKVIIYNKLYNLEHFDHPGGKDILELCKNEPDCTALFESYHAFCDMEKIKEIMNKYVVQDVKTNFFSFKSDGFYKTCRRRVRKIFDNRYIIKSNYESIKTIIMSTLLFICCQYCLLFYPSGWIKMFMSILSGLSLVSLGFNVLHDGSHYALSSNASTNAFLSRIVQSLLMWNHTLWQYHHCIRHHQYTGNIHFDPDMIHLRPYFRKTVKQKPAKSEFTKKWLGSKLILFNILFPGAMFGQALLYHLVWVLKKRLWKMKIPNSFGNYWDFFQYIIMISFVFGNIYYGGWFYFYLHVLGTNIGYFIGLAPDHDMFPTAMEMEKSNGIIDWGEIQVRHSGNFMESYPIFTKFFGGINYQIEHHLFPTLNNHNLRKISPIVKQCCKDFNIPYTSINNPYDVWMAIFKTYKHVHKRNT